MVEKKDYYEVLGVAKNASPDDLKAAYKRLAKQLHPDVSADPKAKEKFQEVLEAYTVLSDAQKRQNYDQVGHSTEGFQGYRGFEGFEGGVDFDFSELFENLGNFGFGFDDFGFGGNRKTRRREKGANLRVDLSVSFDEAAAGFEKKIEVERIENCSACKGTGAKDGVTETCSTCKGSGRVTRSQKTPFGIFSTQTLCGKCQGTGRLAKENCSACKGTGHRSVKKTIEVSIPAGIETGMHLRLSGLGNAGVNGGEAGDLFVVVLVEQHPFFKRDHGDLYCEVPISFSNAALGMELEVATLKGHATVSVPAGTQTGTIFRLKGKGIKDLHSGKVGDQFVKVNIVTPKSLSKEQKRLLEEFQKTEGEQKDKKGFFRSLGL